MRFAVVINGIVDHVIEAPAGFSISGTSLVTCDDSVNRGDSYNGSTFTPAAPVSVTQTKFPPYDFLNLFTTAERTAILASTDTIVRDAVTQVTAIITFVDLASAETQALIGYLVAVSLLSSARAAQVLAGITPS